MGDKELLNRARNDKSAKESELSFTNPVNYALKQNNSKAPRWASVACSTNGGGVRTIAQ